MAESVFGDLKDYSKRTADALNGFKPDAPLATSDYSPPLVPITPGGVDVAAGASAQIMTAHPGRVKVSVNHGGDDGYLWLGFGQPAVEGVGEWLESGGRWEDFFSGALHVLNTGTNTIRVTWMEWGA